MKSYCFGIDVGGTSVKCGLFNTDGTLLEKWEIPTRTEIKARTSFRTLLRRSKPRSQKRILTKMISKVLESEFQDRSTPKEKLPVQ